MGFSCRDKWFLSNIRIVNRRGRRFEVLINERVEGIWDVVFDRDRRVFFW